MAIQDLTDQQLAAMAQQSGINAPAPSGIQSLSDDDLRSMAQQQGVLPPPTFLQNLGNAAKSLGQDVVAGAANVGADVGNFVAGKQLLPKNYGSQRFGPANPNWLDQGIQSLGQNALAGITNFGVDLGNFAAGKEVLPENYGTQQFGPQNPNWFDKGVQGVTQYVPYYLAQEAIAPARLATEAERVMAPLATAGAFGATTDPNNPLQNALVSSLLAGTMGVGGQALGYIGGKVLPAATSAKNALGNLALKIANWASSKGNALTPAEAGENLAKNYTDLQGNPLPVDLGTLISNPTLQNVYNAAGKVPLSGVSTQKNLLKNALFDKKINVIQQQLDSIQNDDPMAPIKQQADAIYKPQLDEMDASVSNLQNQLGEAEKARQANLEQIGDPVSFVNGLKGDYGTPSQFRSNLKSDVSSVYRNVVQPQARANWAPLNDSKIDLTQAGSNAFPNYTSAAQELLANKQNLNNLFGSDSDLGPKLNSEINKAESFLSGGQTWGATLPEMVSRVQMLGKMANSAGGTDNYSASLLKNLQTSLKSDVQRALQQMGRSDLANQWDMANQYHQDYVAPFYNNKNMGQAIQKNGAPNATQLSQELHSPQNVNVLNLLPQTSKNAMLYRLLNKEGGTSSGATALSPEQIASNYQSPTFKDYYKEAISKTNPQADAYLQGLSPAIDNQKALESQRDNIANALAKAVAQQQKTKTKYVSDILKASESSLGAKNKNVQALQDSLNEIKNRKYGAPKEDGHSVNWGALGEGAIGVGLLHALPHLIPLLPAINYSARLAGKILTNPELLQAYVNQMKLPVRQLPQVQNFINNTATPIATAATVGAKRGANK